MLVKFHVSMKMLTSIGAPCMCTEFHSKTNEKKIERSEHRGKIHMVVGNFMKSASYNLLHQSGNVFVVSPFAACSQNYIPEKQ